MTDPRLTTTAVWKSALADLLEQGKPVSPLSAGAAWRGRASRELPGYQTIVPMSAPVVLSAARKLGFRFLAAEAAWICSGDNRVSTIAPYSKVIGKLSDDGVRFFGAYGPKFVDQLSYVVATLLKDPASRQAVITIWREQPRSSSDTPCTLSWQYLLRDGALHCVATMRSSDVWTGWVYDVFNFSMTAAIVALELRAKTFVKNTDIPELATVEKPFEHLTLGNLYLTAGSQHLYEMDVDGAQVCALETEQGSVAPLDLSEFASAQELVDHLWSLARGDGLARHRWLRELYR